MAKAHIAARTDAETLRRLEPIVAAYPALSEEDRGFLLTWYKTQASSYDVGILSTNPQLAEGYARFRKDHIDRITLLDYAKASLWVLVVVGIFVGIFSIR